MAKDIRISFAIDRAGQTLVRRAAKKSKMNVSEYIRETVEREAADDLQDGKDRDRG